MELLVILLGFVLGFGLIFLIRLGQGRLTNCPQCGQQHWVGPKMKDPACKKCGTPLKISGKKTGQVKAAGKKKNKK